MLTTDNFNLFKTIASLDKDVLRISLAKALAETYEYQNVIENENFVMAIGDIPIALVAHLDTVFKTPPARIYYDREEQVIWSPSGGCGDDRAGVFIILNLLVKGHRPTVILTMGEESGGIGASALVKEFKTPPVDFKYIIQLDRSGVDDCVFYDCNNEDFVKYVESFGFKENWGTFSDISVICPEWKIAGVNLSIGYINEHSASETVHVEILMNTFAKVEKMLEKKDIPSFEYIPGLTNYPHYFFDDKYFNDSPTEADYEEEIKCDSCGKTYSYFQVFPINNFVINEIEFCCLDCIGKFAGSVNWCEVCGEMFKSNTDELICDFCKKEQNECTKSYKKISLK